MKGIYLSVALLCLVFSSAASAMEDCSKKTNDPEVFTCAENNKNVAEKALNQEYTAAKVRIDKAFKSDETIKKNYLDVFIEAQRGWLKYRDNQCKLEAHIADENSNPYTVFTNNCIARLDEERTAQIKQIPYDS